MTAHRLHSATALPLKAEALRPLAMMADVFSSFKCLGYDHLGGGQPLPPRIAAGSIKAEQRRPRERGKKREDRGKNRETERLGTKGKTGRDRE